MIIQFTHPVTNETVEIEVDSMNIDELQELYRPKTSEKTLLSSIQNLSLPAEVKALLLKIKEFSIQVGKVALEIGKKILELIIYFVKKFPNVTIGMVVGVFIGMLIGIVPFIGGMFAHIFTPILAALGMGLGFWKDINEVDMKSSMNGAINEFFSSFKNIPTPDNA